METPIGPIVNGIKNKKKKKKKKKGNNNDIKNMLDSVDSISPPPW